MSDDDNFRKLVEQNKRWGHLTIEQTYDMLDHFDQLEAALQDTIKLIEHIDWTAFSLADRAVLDNARAILAALDKERGEVKP